MSSLKQDKRKVTFTIVGNGLDPIIPAPVEALEAILGLVRRIEETGSTASDVTDKFLTVTGKTPYKVYRFKVTIDFASATYTVAYLTEAPNVEEV